MGREFFPQVGYRYLRVNYSNGGTVDDVTTAAPIFKICRRLRWVDDY